MKGNRKFKEKEAVSAVIGVILMVAITVAIAATVYVYVSGMLGSDSESTPNIAFSKTYDRLTVTRADNDIAWNEFQITNNTGPTLTTTYSFDYANDYVTAGDTIEISGSTTITIIHELTNSLLGSWIFTIN